jgi:hypothetical protein
MGSAGVLMSVLRIMHPMRLTTVAAAAALVLATAAVAAQAPGPQPTAPRPGATTPAPEQPAPTEDALGLPIYPGAQFLRSYDAGRGQRYFIFGAQASFPEIVAYYRSVLRQRGELVFDRPGTHMFEVGRYRQATMAFPPGVTVKDFSGTGSGGFPNPRAGAQPARFPTVIQIVPAPPQQ